MLSATNFWMSIAGLIYLVAGVFVLRKEIGVARENAVTRAEQALVILAHFSEPTGLRERDSSSSRTLVPPIARLRPVSLRVAEAYGSPELLVVTICPAADAVQRNDKRPPQPCQ